jgi:predicted SAM-dependent methyltransferase
MLHRLNAYRQWFPKKIRQFAARRALKRMPGPFKLHIGCGEVRFPGWIHLDENARLQNLNARWHASDGLPCPDGSCSFIYNEHFLEHLSPDVGLAFLRECRRALRPDGVLRVAMPDMRESVRQYWDNDWQNQPWMAKYGYSWIQTGCEYLNIAFREWQHLWLYDREELRRRLKEAGFSRIVDAELNASTYPDLQNRETRPESTLICEASR